MPEIRFAKSDSLRPFLYLAEAGAYSFRLFNHDGAWHLFAGVTGAILGTEVKLATMSEARAVAEHFVATIVPTTVSDEIGATVVGDALFAAVAAVRAPAVGIVEPEVVEPAGEPIVVIACGAAKLERTASAAELYTSANFRLHLRAAEALAAELGGRVRILSALHGLIDPAAAIAPYDVKMGDAGSIAVDVLAEQLAELAPRSILTLLPRAYASALDLAAEVAGAGDLVDLFADAPGIGYQRAVSASIVRAAA